ncbi:hypothetical protein HEAFMP_HEAFMP_16010, partial [Dysosmobacter welbionis]
PSSPTWTSRRTTSTASRTRQTASSLPPPGAGRISANCCTLMRP